MKYFWKKCFFLETSRLLKDYEFTVIIDVQIAQVTIQRLTIKRMRGVSPCHDASNAKQQRPKGTYFTYTPITTPRQ